MLIWSHINLVVFFSGFDPFSVKVSQKTKPARLIWYILFNFLVKALAWTIRNCCLKSRWVYTTDSIYNTTFTICTIHVFLSFLCLKTYPQQVNKFFMPFMFCVSCWWVLFIRYAFTIWIIAFSYAFWCNVSCVHEFFSNLYAFTRWIPI